MQEKIVTATSPAAPEGEERGRRPVEFENGAADFVRSLAPMPVTLADQRRALSIMKPELDYAKSVGGLSSVLVRMQESMSLAELLPDDAPGRAEIEAAAARAKGRAEEYGLVALKTLETLVSNASRKLA